MSVTPQVAKDSSYFFVSVGRHDLLLHRFFRLLLYVK